MERKGEDSTCECCAGLQCASRLLISEVRCEAEKAVLEVGGLVVGLAVGKLAVPLQAALALGLWEEGWSLLEAL